MPVGALLHFLREEKKRERCNNFSVVSFLEMFATILIIFLHFLAKVLFSLSPFFLMFLMKAKEKVKLTVLQ